MPELRWLHAAMVCGLVTTALLVMASSARAADRIYWSNDFGDTISYANLDGSGGGRDLPTDLATVDGPMGLAIDSAAGRIYWANWGALNPDDTGTGTTISWANLDGSGGGDVPITGAAVTGPHGLAIDPTAGKIYWPDVNDNQISYANLNGSNGDNLNTTGATVDQPRGLAIDPATRRIYWANWQDGTGTTISYADLDGSGGHDLDTIGATVDGPEGVALDPGAGRIYWGNFSNADSIAYANLNGSGGAHDLDTTGATVANAHGVAVDPIAGKIYWPNFYANIISWANLNGSGGGDFPPSATAGATVNGPDLPALLETPSGAGAPTISGGSAPDSVLSCSQGSWAPDLLSSLLYRAPQSFAYQWSLNGADVAGATTSSYTAKTRGDYRCMVTASNPAGSASQTSDPLPVSASKTSKPSNAFRFIRLKRNTETGTATLVVSVPGPGALTLTGRRVVRERPAHRAEGVAARTVHGNGNVKLLVKAKGKAKGKLTRTGKVKVGVKVTFIPIGGTPKARARVLKLREKIRR